MGHQVPTATHSLRDVATRNLFDLLRTTADPTARRRISERIAEANLPLCDALAGRYRGRGVDHDDLVQVARMALWLAVERYQDDQGASFASFAIPTITGELKRYFRDHGWTIRPPRRLQELRAKAVSARSDWEQRLGRELSVGELAEHLGVQADQLRDALGSSNSYRPHSLDVPHREGSGESVGARLPADADLASTSVDRLTLRRALNLLTRRDRALLEWRYVEECTQREIAGRLGISQMQVSRLLKGILAGLRDELEPEPAPMVG